MGKNLRSSHSSPRTSKSLRYNVRDESPFYKTSRSLDGGEGALLGKFAPKSNTIEPGTSMKTKGTMHATSFVQNTSSSTGDTQESSSVDSQVAVGDEELSEPQLVHDSRKVPYLEPYTHWQSSKDRRKSSLGRNRHHSSLQRRSDTSDASSHRDESVSSGHARDKRSDRCESKAKERHSRSARSPKHGNSVFSPSLGSTSAPASRSHERSPREVFSSSKEPFYRNSHLDCNSKDAPLKRERNNAEEKGEHFIPRRKIHRQLPSTPLETSSPVTHGRADSRLEVVETAVECIKGHEKVLAEGPVPMEEEMTAKTKKRSKSSKSKTKKSSTSKKKSSASPKLEDDPFSLRSPKTSKRKRNKNKESKDVSKISGKESSVVSDDRQALATRAPYAESHRCSSVDDFSGKDADSGTLQLGQTQKSLKKKKKIKKHKKEKTKEEQSKAKGKKEKGERRNLNDYVNENNVCGKENAPKYEPKLEISHSKASAPKTAHSRRKPEASTRKTLQHDGVEEDSVASATADIALAVDSKNALAEAGLNASKSPCGEEIRATELPCDAGVNTAFVKMKTSARDLVRKIPFLSASTGQRNVDKNHAGLHRPRSNLNVKTGEIASESIKNSSGPPASVAEPSWYTHSNHSASQHRLSVQSAKLLVSHEFDDDRDMPTHRKVWKSYSNSRKSLIKDDLPWYYISEDPMQTETSTEWNSQGSRGSTMKMIFFLVSNDVEEASQ